MVFFGDTLIRFDKRSADAAIPDVQTAIRTFRHPDKQNALREISAGEKIPYASWETKITYAEKRHFVSLLDFLVNLPQVQDSLDNTGITDTWLWNPVTPMRFSKTLQQVQGSSQLLARIPLVYEKQGGWLLSRSYGRIDEDVTWSSETYLLECKSHFLYVCTYGETLH